MKRLRSPNLRRFVAVSLILGMILTVFLISRQGVPEAQQNQTVRAGTSTGDGTVTPSEIMAGVAGAEALVDLPEQRWTLSDGGRKKDFQLALDEVVIRDAEGMDHRRELVPAATRATYANRVAELASEGTVLPVVYPADEEKTPSNFRLVTSSLPAMHSASERAWATRKRWPWRSLLR